MIQCLGLTIGNLLLLTQVIHGLIYYDAKMTTILVFARLVVPLTSHDEEPMNNPKTNRFRIFYENRQRLPSQNRKILLKDKMVCTNTF